MMQNFTTPLSIIKCKLTDRLVFSVDDVSPYWPSLSVYNIGGGVVLGPLAPMAAIGDTLYWYFRFDAVTFAAKQYYLIKAHDDDTSGYPDTRWKVYVTDDYSFEGYVVRSLGLAGHNIRKYNHTWVRGQLTGFDIKIYTSATDLDAAEAGTADNYIAHYQVTIRYNSEYNAFEITSVKQ